MLVGHRIAWHPLFQKIIYIYNSNFINNKAVAMIYTYIVLASMNDPDVLFLYIGCDHCRSSFLIGQIGLVIVSRQISSFISIKRRAI